MVLTSRADTEQFWGSSPSLPMLPKIHQIEAPSREHHYRCVPRTELYTADAHISICYL